MRLVPDKPLPRWRTDVFLALVGMLNYGDRSVLPVIFPGIRGELKLSEVEFGVLGSLFLWSYALCGPVAGMLADRYSRRLQIVTSLAAWSLATALAGAANGFLVLALLRIALGVGEGFYLPAAIALLGDHHDPSTRGRALGFQSLAQTFGAVLGGACAGYLAERHGWRFSFWTLGGLGILLAASGRWFLGVPPSERRAVKAASPSSRGSVRDAILYLVRSPTYLLLLLETILTGIAVWIFFNWMPLYLYEKFGLKMGEAGFAGMAMLQISSMLGVIIGSWLSDHVARRELRNRLRIFGACFIGAAPLLLIFLVRPSYPVVVVAVSLFSLLRAIGAVNEMPVLCDVVPAPYRSTAMGIFILCACAAGGVGIIVAGFLKQSLGLDTVFASLSGVFILAGLGMLLGYYAFGQRDLARAGSWSSATVS